MENGVFPFIFVPQLLENYYKTEHSRSLYVVSQKVGALPFILLLCRLNQNDSIMAGKTKEMSKIKQVLRQHLDGVSNRKIATSLGLNKETVNKYVRMAKEDPMKLSELLALEDPVLEHRMTGGNPAYVDTRFESFKLKLPYFEQQMGHKHVTLKKLWEEYILENPDGYQLTQFRFHYKQNCKAKMKPSTVLNDLYEPGEKAYLDFAGDRLEYIDMDTGEVIRPQTFVASLPCTDYGFAYAVPSQRSEDFIHAIICFLRHIGGVPRILVPDNLKAAVTKSDPYEPDINKIMEDLANHYGCVVLPARPGKPKDKCLVENHVKLVYQRVYAELRNMKFYSLEELNTAIAQKMKAHNRKRMQQHEYSREEHFLAVEKPALKPLPEADFEIRSYTNLKVATNGCIYLGRDKHHYSVPYQYMHQSVKVIYTRTLVKVFCRNECIATHQRVYTPGKYTVINEHLASHSLAYRSRSKDYYIHRAESIMDVLGDVVRYMFLTSNQPEEVYYKSCDGLLHLARATDPLLFRKACETALAYQRYSYPFISNLIKSRCSGIDRQKDNDTAKLSPPANHKNIRGRNEYN